MENGRVSGMEKAKVSSASTNNNYNNNNNNNNNNNTITTKYHHHEVSSGNNNNNNNNNNNTKQRSHWNTMAHNKPRAVYELRRDNYQKTIINRSGRSQLLQPPPQHPIVAVLVNDPRVVKLLFAEPSHLFTPDKETRQTPTFPKAPTYWKVYERKMQAPPSILNVAATALVVACVSEP
ncbi:hypothetical protein Pmani_034550 [Petrolisthes manimaculis]|uniref:Uncharacterized protein n=1 Tax=Petrolisthes manimaculis TaxID=1843537 RepID=A0AAE1TRH2_9EUCA|nr:hypothetical protein Pmani_034550 [Petrolisthes manimaculis]